MLIKKLKLKSVSRRIRQLLQERKTGTTQNKIESLTIIVDIDAFTDTSKFDSLLKPLNLSKNQFKLIAFSAEKKTVKEYSGNLFTPSKLGWRGKVKDADIKQVLQQPTDLLISYYDKEKVVLEFLTAFSKASFKVGFHKSNHELNDLIINCKVSEFKIFRKELLKYLTVLNKL